MSVKEAFEQWAKEEDISEYTAINAITGFRAGYNARKPEIDKLKKDIEELRECLSFYADEDDFE